MIESFRELILWAIVLISSCGLVGIVGSIIISFRYGSVKPQKLNHFTLPMMNGSEKVV